MPAIEVLGIPRPGGSKTAGRANNGRLFVRDANPNTSIWKEEVRKQAKQQYFGEMLTGPVEMFYEFRFERPKHHFRRNGELKATAPVWHTNTPDLTKVIRSTEDALLGLIYKDDSQVAKRGDCKRYCNGPEQPGVTIAFFELLDESL